ncbi:MAG: alpha/beta hydrolase [Anaerolineales bacterium]|nr:alpha/beta hydrolase [Anaerolineales bacterium]
MKKFQICESKYLLPEGVSATCGYVSVPLDHANPRGNVIELYVTRLSSTNPNPAPEPVFWLHGGPGMHSKLYLAAEDGRVQALLKYFDVVVFDQRGGGYSKPALFCPELDDLVLEMAISGVCGQERARRYMETALSCHSRLVAEGIEPEFFNTVQNSNDIIGLADVFGYDRINLYGISYGTRLAMMAMRNHPGRIRSVILDSVVPIQASQPVTALENFYNAMEIFFADCASDPKAARMYPSIKEEYYDLLSRLCQSPVAVPIIHPKTGATVEIPVDAETLNGLLFNIFYSHKSILLLPRLIHSLYRGESLLFKELLNRHLFPKQEFPTWSLGAFYSMMCCDDRVGTNTAQEILQDRDKYPVWRLPYTEFQIGEYISSLCASWRSKKFGWAETEPLESDIPTLVLSGQYDADTSAKWGRQVAEKLENGCFFEFRRAGHGIIDFHPNLLEIIGQFFENPNTKPDDALLKAIPLPEFEEMDADEEK